MMNDAYVLVNADGSSIIAKVMRPTNLSPDYRVSVQVTNTYRPVLESLVEEYGRSIGNKPQTVGSFFSRRCNWAVGSEQAIKRRLQPHLIIKQDQAALAIEFWERRTVAMGTRPIPKEELREGFYQAMKSLKQPQAAMAV